MLGQVQGSLVGGFSGSRLGPRTTIRLCILVSLVGWIIIATAPLLPLLLLGRLLDGTANGAMLTNSTLLVAQYTTHTRRGPYLSMHSLMLSVGITVVYVTGALASWRLVAVVPGATIIHCTSYLRVK